MDSTPAPDGLARDEAGLATWLRERLAVLLDLEPLEIDADASMEDYGLASSDAVLLVDELSVVMGQPVSPVVFWEHTTVADLAAFLAAVARGEAELPEDLLDIELDLGFDLG